jgi:hypothetical protein
MVGFCEHANEPSGLVKSSRLHEWLSNSWLTKKDSAPWNQSVSQSVSQPVDALKYSFALKYEFSACHFHMPYTHWLLLWRRPREWPGRTAPLDGANIDQSRGPSVSTPLCCHQTEPSSSHKQSHLYFEDKRIIAAFFSRISFYPSMSYLVFSLFVFLLLFLSFVIYLSLSSSSSAIMCKNETILT